MNTRVLLRERPVGAIEPEKTFEVVRAPMDAHQLLEGDVLVRTLFLSLDPAMRGWLDDKPSYLPPVKVGAVMRGGSMGVVVESKNAAFAAGDLVDAQGTGGWQQYFVDRKARNLLKLDPGTDLLAAMGPLGMTGLTAYFGLLEVGKPRAGETIVVSGAAGATGSVVGQIGKIMGCRVVGMAGTDEKCRWLTEELGFDGAINYRTAGGAAGLDKALREHCPKGVDVYFDNVGGDILDAVLLRLRMRARVVLCGAISQYNSEAVAGPKNYLTLLTKRATMAGFIVFDYLARYAEARAQLQAWLDNGKLKFKVDVIDGLENAPQGLLKLFTGANKGKLAVQCAPLPSKL